MFILIAVGAVVGGVVGLSVLTLVKRSRVGGDGIWYGTDEPPEGFVGFWDKGHVVVQWPKPGNVNEIVIEGLTADDLVSRNMLYDDIIVSNISAENITATSGTVEDIINDPDFPGMITTKQELANRRKEEK